MLSFAQLRTAALPAILALLFSAPGHATNPPVASGDTLIVGDSVFALSGDIQRYLEQDLNEEIDSHARSGCQLIGGNLICSRRYAIPQQYANASKSGIDTVVFNGGGNDIQLNSCRPSLSACMPLLNDLEAEIAKLVQRMKADGIENIIFLGYYNGTGQATELREINEYSMDYKAANYPAMGVTFIDVRDAFNGNEAQYIASDGIHPTAAGSRVLADLILQELD